MGLRGGAEDRWTSLRLLHFTAAPHHRQGGNECLSPGTGHIGRQRSLLPSKRCYLLLVSCRLATVESLVSVTMTRSRGRDQERRLTVIDTALPAPAPPTWRPDPKRVENHDVDLPLIDMGRIKGRQGLDLDTGRLVEFSISAHITYRGRWSEVARVDTAHEEVHLHVLSRRGLYIYREVLLPITGPHDVDRGWVVGYKRLLTGWELHERMWRRGTPSPSAGRGCP